MTTTYDLGRRRRPEARHWIALAAAAAAVVVLVVLIAAACRGGDNESLMLSADPVPTGTAGLGSGTDDDSAAGDQSDPDGADDGGAASSGGDGDPGDGGGGDPGDGGGGDPGDGGDGDPGDGDPGDDGGVALAGVELATRDVVVPAGGFVRDTVVCPAGKVALAGGARVVGAGSADFGTQVRESGPGTIGGGAQSLWLVAVSNGGANARTVRLATVCAEPPPGYQLAEADAVVASGGGFVRHNAACPEDTVVLGGGVQVIGAGSADFRTRIQESAPGMVGGGPHSVWLAAISSTDTQDRTVRVRAVCAEQPAGFDAVTVEHTLGGGGFLREAVTCPGGTVALGGGAAVAGAGSGNFRTFVRETGISATGGAPQGWLVAMANASGTERTVRTVVLCAAG